MPVRVLAFNADGSTLQLIERNEILHRLRDDFYDQLNQLCLKYPEKTTMYDSDWLSKQEGEEEEQFITDFLTNRAGYAILSHTWIRDTPGDVIYNDWNMRHGNPRGNAKITKFCEVAARDYGVTFGWLDTVCINKESSSELDESIRSMYKWYRESHVCITYLSEVSMVPFMHRDSWFTRGWTLQELLAPRNIRFYNKDWLPLVSTHSTLPGSGSNSIDSVDIQSQIQNATGITKLELDLCKQGNIEKIYVSRRIELAASRNVTRAEDMAYSLMGILGVEITIAYGEGKERAFFRLVRELLNSSKNILDVFNHGYKPSNKLIPISINQYVSRSSDFDVSDYQTPSPLDSWQPPEPIIYTHLGLRVSLLLIPGVELPRPPYPHSLPRYTTLGDFSGTIRLSPIYTNTTFFLLHKDIYFDKHRYSGNEPRAMPSIVSFGVLNFSMSTDGAVILPDLCLALPLNCGGKTHNVGPSDVTTIVPTRKPVVFQLKSSRDTNWIPQCMLGTHGMQLITLYLD